MVQHGKVCPACGKRGTPQKRKAAAAAATPCPLAHFKRSRNGFNTAKAESDLKTDASSQQDQDSAQAGGVNGQAAAAAPPSCKRLQQPVELLRSEENSSMQVPLFGHAAVVSIKAEPGEVDQGAGAEHKTAVVTAGTRDPAAAAAPMTTATAAAGLIKCEADHSVALNTHAELRQSASCDTAGLHPTSHSMQRVLRPRRPR